jgi:hypothetical protein
MLRRPSSRNATVRHILLVVLMLSGSTALHAQWRLAALSASAASHGDARDDTDPSHPEFHADRPFTLTVALARDAGRWRLGIEGRHRSADLSEVSHTVAVTTFGAFEAWGAGLELGVRVAGQPSAAELRAGLGLGGDRWRLEGASARWRATAAGFLEADLPVTRNWNAVVRAELTTRPSVFRAEELPEGFSRRTNWEAGIALGLARRL